jgi:hypothetical protein
MNLGLNLHRDTWQARVMRDALMRPDRPMGIVAARYIYYVASLIRYFINIAVYPLEVINRVVVSYQVIIRRINRKRIVPDRL